MKKQFNFFLVFLTVLFITSCNTNLTKDKLVGKSFQIDGFHTVKFISESSYEIMQYSNGGQSCYGTGNWTITENKITLEYNNSSCESTINMRGVYKVSDNWLVK